MAQDRPEPPLLASSGFTKESKPLHRSMHRQAVQRVSENTLDELTEEQLENLARKLAVGAKRGDVILLKGYLVILRCVLLF